MNVTVVTVTYGKRAHLLTQVLDAAREQGVDQAIVIDNGSEDSIPELVADKYSGWAEVESLGANLGSAAAFSAAFKAALRKRAEYILTLDDDNVMQEGCVAALKAAYQEIASAKGTHVAVCGYRQKFFFGSIRRLLAGGTKRVESSFHGFHVCDIPGRFRRRFLTKENDPTLDTAHAVLALDHCTYGGLFVHRRLIERIGLPNRDFFLYEDYEFTNRIINIGGHINLVCDAKITDIDETWSEKHKAFVGFFSYLHTDRPSLAYYSFRNSCFYDFHVFPCNEAIVFFNSILFMTMLFSYAVFAGRLATFGIFFRAYIDGLFGQLGYRDTFPLRQPV